MTNPATVPGIYTKLLEVDKVDLIISGYGTNLIAPLLPIAMERKLTLIGMFGLANNEKYQYPNYFQIQPAGPDPQISTAIGFFELAAKQKAYKNLYASQPSNPLQVPAWKQACNELAADIDRTSRKVARLTNDIPVHKARLDAVPKMRDFLAKMHQAATIRLRIVAECGEHDIVLVSATLDSQSAE